MTFATELKKIRQRSFLSQEDFANILKVSFSTVNRWENGKTKPNLIAMKKIKEFCIQNDIVFTTIESLWLSMEEEGVK